MSKPQEKKFMESFGNGLLDVNPDVGRLMQEDIKIVMKCGAF